MIADGLDAEVARIRAVQPSRQTCTAGLTRHLGNRFKDVNVRFGEINNRINGLATELRGEMRRLRAEVLPGGRSGASAGNVMRRRAPRCS